ncbi:hypothetical protein MLD52_01180 [Puniceicoccaceae bacterium K14]|nr:hypothetical protein [Puniceicoccaceae bacterium K14]
MNFETETQISVSIENKLGQLAEISELLTENNIHIQAISTIGDEMRFICSKPDTALKVLKNLGYKTSQAEVFSIKLQDSQGRLSSIAQTLARSNINIDYVYATTTENKSSAKLILKVSNIPMARNILEQEDLGAA